MWQQNQMFLTDLEKNNSSIGIGEKKQYFKPNHDVFLTTNQSIGTEL